MSAAPKVWHVHELAKDLGAINKTVLDALKDAGTAVTNHMSALSDAQVKAVRARVPKKLASVMKGSQAETRAKAKTAAAKAAAAKAAEREAQRKADEAARSEQEAAEEAAAAAAAKIAKAKAAKAKPGEAPEAPPVAKKTTKTKAAAAQAAEPALRGTLIRAEDLPKPAAPAVPPAVAAELPGEEPPPEAAADVKPAPAARAKPVPAPKAAAPRPAAMRPGSGPDALAGESVAAVFGSTLSHLVKPTHGAAIRPIIAVSPGTPVSTPIPRLLVPPGAPPSRPGQPPRGAGPQRFGGGRPHHARRPGGRKRRGPLPERQPAAFVAPIPVTDLMPVDLPDLMSVSDLAAAVGVSVNEIIKAFMRQGMMLTINQAIDFDKAAAVARTFGFEATMSAQQEEVVIAEEEDASLLVARPPVVTVLGHVDHGKTSLLDAIRNTNVTEGEAGGITQRIGAYMVDHNGRKVVFLDTPGHEAFTAMRARGAKVTDVAVLVVAADDGVMPQTEEALNHAKAAGVPIVVAVNKIDKPNANPERVKQQLAALELLPEEWGGKTPFVPVSAKQRIGIDALLEMVLLVADLQEVKANPNRQATGTIIEAKLDKGLGPVATVLVQNGTLKVGDIVVVGSVSGRVRGLINDHGDRISKAPPATPVEIVGLSEVPQAGDILQVVEDEKMARQIVEARAFRAKEEKHRSQSRTSLEDLFKQMETGKVKDLRIIVKADTHGSLEALRHALQRLSSDRVRVQVIHGGAGTVTESDILLATASEAIIIGFNIRSAPNVARLAEQEGVDVRYYRVIYHAIEDVKKAMEGLLEPEFKEVQLGRAEVRQVFKVSKGGVIVGVMVQDGVIARTADIRVLRDNAVVHEGKIDSLKRFKDDAREVAAGYECGIGIVKFPGLQVGDIIEAYTVQEVERVAETTGSAAGKA